MNRFLPLSVLSGLVAAAALQGCATGPSPASATSAGGNAGAGAAAPTYTVSKATPQQQADLAAALAMVKAGQLDAAADALRKLAAALPDDPVPAIDLGLLHAQQEQAKPAEEQFRKALAIDPGNPVASVELALLYRQAGRFAEARAVYEKTLARYPDFALAHHNLGVLCDLYLRDTACAIDHYTTWARTAPDDKSVRIWIADLEKRSAPKEARQ